MHKKTVSVIIPIYKGERYIPYWLDILSKNVEKLEGNEAEVLFINDYPAEELQQITSSLNFCAKVYNTNINRGIHGARVYGLEQAIGDYVIFLDQDDRISEDYIVTQLASIGEADAVLGNGLNEHYCCERKDVIYATELAHQNAVLLNVLLDCGNTIVSPGQVMILKKSIPEIWRRDILKSNGADDYFLWLIMLSEGKKFAINRKNIYLHVATGANLSLNDSSMHASLREMLSYLEQEKVIESEQLKKIEGRIGGQRSRWAVINDMFDRWLYAVTHGQKTEDYFNDHNYNRVAIYGMHRVGGRLYGILKNTEIDVRFGVDKNADRFVYDVPLIKPDEIGDRVNDVDVIVATMANGYEAVRDLLYKKGFKAVVSIDDVINYMIDRIES